MPSQFDEDTPQVLFVKPDVSRGGDEHGVWALTQSAGATRRVLL
jgi:hypothetical protein